MATITYALARSPLYYWHADHGARFTELHGWQLPAVYTSIEQEAASARAAVGLADITSFAKISLLGQAVPVLTWSLVSGGAALKPPGVSRFSAIGPMLACRLSEESLLILASTTMAAGLEQYLASVGRGQSVVQSNETSAYAGFWLIGPRLEEVLQRVTSLNVAPVGLPLETCAQTNLAGVPALLVRSAELPLPSIRVYVTWDLAEYVWETLLAAGRDLPIQPLGLETIQHIQKGDGASAPPPASV